MNLRRHRNCLNISDSLKVSQVILRKSARWSKNSRMNISWECLMQGCSVPRCTISTRKIKSSFCHQRKWWYIKLNRAEDSSNLISSVTSRHSSSRKVSLTVALSVPLASQCGSSITSIFCGKLSALPRVLSNTRIKTGSRKQLSCYIKTDMCPRWKKNCRRQ